MNLLISKNLHLVREVLQMKIKCEYCGSYIDDTDEKCKNCGAVNTHLRRNSNATPKTIEELKQWYVVHNLPDENITRFFIGKNYKGARAFGIYKDEESGNFVVYKNKQDGTRAIRYEGKDESYAVNELYIRLKEEIVNQKQNNINNGSNQRRKPHCKIIMIQLLAIFVVPVILNLIMFVSMLTIFNGPSSGYYKYNNNYYYCQYGKWYEYDDSRGWRHSVVPDELDDNYKDYYWSSTYYSNYGIDDFEDSIYYQAPSTSSSSSSSDWDSSSSWDSDSSWDSSSTDWDSDW